MTATTTTTTAGSASRPADPWHVPADRFTGPAVVLPEDECAALVRGLALPIPGTVAARGVAMLAEVLDVSTIDDARRALTFPGARSALVTAVALCQHGETFEDASSDEGDGTTLASFLSLAVATARLVRQEDDDVDTVGRPERGDASWREYVERCGRIALVRSLRHRPDTFTLPEARDAMYRTARADDPAVTAPRAPRKSRSPGAAVASVPRSRSERRRDETARAAMVTADAMGADLPRLLGTGDQAFTSTVVGDPVCPVHERDLSLPEGERSGHRCSLRCFYGGWHAYSPRQSAAHRTLPAGTYGPVLADDTDVAYVWRPFRCFPEGVAVVRSHSDAGTDARLGDRGRVRLTWAPDRATQRLTAGDKRFTPATFPNRGNVAKVPTRTAEHLAAGGTFDRECVTRYQGVTFVGHRRTVVTVAPSNDPVVQRTRARTRRAMTPQQQAVVTLIVDAATLVMFDGRPRTAHRDDQGRGYVVTRTGDGTLTLVTPDGITSPLPTDPRRMTAAVRAATV